MLASAPHVQAQTPSTFAPSLSRPGASGGVRVLLRLEGAAAVAAAVALYAHAGFSWPLFALCFLAPDLAMLGYVAGPRVGAVLYNLVHTYTLALASAAAGFWGGLPVLAASSLILIAHIGFDRALGFGLKYSTAFGDTHLSSVSGR